MEKAEKAEKDKIDIHIFKLSEQLAKKIHFKDKRALDKAVLLVQELIHNQKDATWYPHYLALSNHIEWVYAHSINLALISCLIGIELNYPEKRMQDLALGALLHDIGMIVLPKSLLNNYGNLNEMQQRMMRSHCEIGYALLEDCQVSSVCKNIISQHHEHNDGTGYPNQLEENDIIEEAKIVAIAEFLDTDTTTRPNAVRREIQEVLDEMFSKKHTYDKKLVQIIAGQMS